VIADQAVLRHLHGHRQHSLDRLVEFASIPFHAPNDVFRLARLHEGLGASARLWSIAGKAGA
jgi:hypothetical protein